MFSTLARGARSLQQAAQSSTAPQSATATIDKLCDRLLNAEHLEERKAALLGLKGLSRDWKSDVGARALPILLGVLEEDAQDDVEMAKAVVETMSLLCEVEEIDGRPVRDDSGLRNTDVFLSTPTPLHTLLTLLTPMHFYLRFFSLQLLGILLANRPAQVQQYVLVAAGGVGRLVETLDDSREIIRNESLLLIIALTTQNADIQKLLAFEGAFDKLFSIVKSEGGIGSGGIVVQDCLAAVGGLLRWNVSNQNYFRETSCIPLFAPLLLFPRPNALTPQSLSTFAFQSWSEQKVINAGLVISLVRMLVGGAGSGRAGNQKALLQTGLTRCLIEMGLASNAPAVLKAQSLNALADILRLSPDNQSLLTSLIVTPLIPPAAPSSPETYLNDDPTSPVNSHHPHQHQYDHDHKGGGGYPEPKPLKWRRGEPVPAVVAVVNLAVNGDGTPGREGLRVRAAAASLFENYVAGANDTQLGLLSTMATPQPEAFDGDTSGRTSSAGSILLRALRVFPQNTPNDPFDSYIPFFASLLFSHLLLHSETSKTLARRIYFQGDDSEPGGEGDEDERTSLVSILVGNLMMAQREQAQSQNAGLGPERALEWSRVMCGYLTVLSVWLWESPKTVKEFLSEGSNLQVLIQPITQSSGVDSVVQGLCAFLLGIVYEFNREPGGAISRETLHPILQSRVGPDQFVSRILRLREDPRFRNVGPTVLELIDEDDASADDLGEEDGLWFDFAFVEFLKTEYISVQRSILVDPHATSNVTRSAAAPGSSEVLAAMRDTIAEQSKELDELRELVHQLQQERDEERTAYQHEVASLSSSILQLRTSLATLQNEKEDSEREQEDLLVLLEDLSQKWREGKRRLRKAGEEVSEDEEGEEEEIEEDEEEKQEAETVSAAAPPVREAPKDVEQEEEPVHQQQQQDYTPMSAAVSVVNEDSASPASPAQIEREPTPPVEEASVAEIAVVHEEPAVEEQEQEQESAPAVDEAFSYEPPAPYEAPGSYEPTQPVFHRDESPKREAVPVKADQPLSGLSGSIASLFNAAKARSASARAAFDPYAPQPPYPKREEAVADHYSAPPSRHDSPFNPYAPASAKRIEPVFDPYAPSEKREDPYAPSAAQPQQDLPRDPFAPPPSQQEKPYDPFTSSFPLAPPPPKISTPAPSSTGPPRDPFAPVPQPPQQAFPRDPFAPISQDPPTPSFSPARPPPKASAVPPIKPEALHDPFAIPIVSPRKPKKATRSYSPFAPIQPEREEEKGYREKFPPAPPPPRSSATAAAVVVAKKEEPPKKEEEVVPAAVAPPPPKAKVEEKEPQPEVVEKIEEKVEEETADVERKPTLVSKRSFDPFAPLRGSTKPPSVFTPPTTTAALSYDPFAPLPMSTTGLASSQPKPVASSYDPFAPLPASTGLAASQPKPAASSYDPFAPLKPAASSYDPFAPLKREEPKKEELKEEEEKADVKQEGKDTEQPHDPFAAASTRYDPFASSAPERDPFASSASAHDPFAASAPPPARDPFRTSVSLRNDPFSPPPAIRDPFSPPPASTVALPPQQQLQHDPFASTPQHDVFASIQHSRAPSAQSTHSAPRAASVQSNRAFAPVQHDPFNPPQPKQQQQKQQQKAYDPFAPPEQRQQEQQHDRVLSNPFGLSASSASNNSSFSQGGGGQQNDDLYSPFGSSSYQNNDPFGLASTSLHSSGVGNGNGNGQEEQYSPFGGAPASASSGHGHSGSAAHRDVSDLFR